MTISNISRFAPANVKNRGDAREWAVCSHMGVERSKHDSKAYDRVIFGFPIWASNVAPPIRTFIKENDLSGKSAAVFACQTADGANKAFVKLKALLGRDQLDAEGVFLDPKTKPSAENDRMIKAFCDSLA